MATVDEILNRVKAQQENQSVNRSGRVDEILQRVKAQTETAESERRSSVDEILSRVENQKQDRSARVDEIIEKSKRPSRPATLDATMPMRPSARMSTPAELARAQAGIGRVEPGGLTEQLIGPQEQLPPPRLVETVSGEGGIEDQAKFIRERLSQRLGELRDKQQAGTATPEEIEQSQRFADMLSRDTGLGELGGDVAMAKAMGKVSMGTQAVTRGLTLGLSDLVINKIYDAYGVNKQDASPETTSELLMTAGLDALGGLLTGKVLFGGVGGRTGQLARGPSGVLRPDLITRGGAQALMKNKKSLLALTTLRAGMGGSTSAVRNATAVASGDKEIGEALRDVSVDTVASALSVVPEQLVKPGMANFVSQVVGGVITDLVADTAITGRFQEQGAKEWMINEIPRIVMDVIFAGADLTDPNFAGNQKAMQRQTRKAITDIFNGVKSRFGRAGRNDFDDARQIGFRGEDGSLVDLSSIMREVATEMRGEPTVVDRLLPGREIGSRTPTGESEDIAAAEREFRGGVRADAESQRGVDTLLGRSARMEVTPEGEISTFPRTQQEVDDAQVQRPEAEVRTEQGEQAVRQPEAQEALKVEATERGLPPEATPPAPRPPAPPDPRVNAADQETTSVKPENLRAEARVQNQAGFIANPATGVDNFFGRLKSRIADARLGREARAKIEMDNEVARIKASRAGKSIGKLRRQLTQKGYQDQYVFDDLNRLLGETEYELGGSRWFEDDFARLSVKELKRLAKRSGVKVGKNATKDQILKGVIGAATNLRIDINGFVAKYNLDSRQEAILRSNVDLAKQQAAELEASLREAGLEQLGARVGENEFYSRRQYRYHLLGGKFNPTDADKAAASQVVEKGLERSVTRVEEEATKLNQLGEQIQASAGLPDNPVKMAEFLQTGDRKYIAALSDEDRDLAHRLRTTFDSLESTRTFVNTATDGSVSIGRSATGMKEAADFIIEEMVKPTKGSSGGTTGFGAAQDALLRREMIDVFRNLRGEIKDPEFRFGVSREAQGLLLSNMAVMNDLARMGGLYSNSKQDGDARGHTVRLGRDQSPTAKVTAADRRRFGQMAGKWVSKSFADSLGYTPRKNIENPNLWQAAKMGAEAVNTGLGRAGGFVRGLAVMRPAAIMRDAMTNITGFAGMAGDWGGTFNKAYAEATKHVFNLATKDQAKKAAAQDFMEELASLGLFRAGQASMTQEIEGVFKGAGRVGDAWDAAVRARSIVADAPVKWAGYQARLAILRRGHARRLKAGLVTDDELKQMAADHVRLVYDNRDAVPGWLRTVARNPLFPDYATFKYSSGRAYINSLREALADLRDPNILKRDSIKRLADMVTSSSLSAVFAVKKPAVVAGAGAAIAEALATVHGDVVSNPQEADEDIESAIRFMGEEHYTYDPMSVYNDDNGKYVRIVWSGGLTPFPFIDAFNGMIWDSDPRENYGEKRFDRLRELAFGGDLPMVPNAIANVGKNLMDVYDSRTRDAFEHASKISEVDLIKQAGAETILQFMRDTGGWYGRVGAEAAGSGDVFKEQLRRRTSELKRGQKAVEVPRGFGPRPGMPVEKLEPSRNLWDAMVSGWLPVKVSVYEPGDVKFNLFNKARKMKSDALKFTQGEQAARGTMNKREIFELERDLLKPMNDWVNHATVLMENAGERNIKAQLADILVKAGFSDTNVRIILSGDRRSAE